MSDSVRSFKQYRRYIAQLLKPLSAEEGLKFASWCVGRFTDEFGEVVWDGLSRSEKEALMEMIDSVHTAADTNGLASPSQAAAFQKQLVEFGPVDEVEAIEVTRTRLSFEV